MGSKKTLKVEHGIICRVPNQKLGYFAWPTVARMDDGTLLVACSGLRSRHVCPWGKTVLNVSHDDGRTWSGPSIIQKSPLDDRDAGIINLGGNRVLVSWFTSDTRTYIEKDGKVWGKAEMDNWRKTTDTWTDAIVRQWIGSWIILSDNGGATWSAPIQAPVTAPHGPIRLQNGDLLYLGKSFMD